MSDRLVIVDGHNILYRSFFAMSTSNLRTTQGEPTGALFGTLQALRVYLREMMPTHMLWCFDRGRSAFRTALREGYKGHRKYASTEVAIDPRRDLPPQTTAFVEFLDLYGIAHHSEDGVEADDLIATAVGRFAEMIDVVVVSGDHDLLQLVSDRVRVYRPGQQAKRGAIGLRTHTALYGPQEVYDKYLVDPDQLATLWALTGDKSDCQPPGTQVLVKRGLRVAEYDEKPIEEVRVGEMVLSYNNVDGSWPVGIVEAVSEQGFEDDLIRVESSLSVSRYTSGHRCMAALGELDGKHCVYLMCKGDKYRVGSTRLGFSDGSNPRNRLAGEHGDAMWILDAYESREQCLLEEQIVAFRYGIPDIRFYDELRRERLTAFWSSVGDMTAQAKRCLADYGREMEYPYASRGDVRIPSKYLAEVRAANLMSGMEVLELTHIPNGERLRHFASTDSVRRSRIVVSRSRHGGSVYSLKVSGPQTYVADRILTHNSIEGISGVGPKTAAKWIATHGSSLTRILLAEEKCRGYERRCWENYQMIDLDGTVGTIPFDLPELRLPERVAMAPLAKFEDYFRRWEMTSLFEIFSRENGW